MQKMEFISQSGRCPGGEWQPTPAYYAWKIPWREETAVLQSMGYKESVLTEPLSTAQLKFCVTMSFTTFTET